jgi:hypothetical protein
MTMSENNELVVSGGPAGSLHETPMAISLGETFGLDPRQVIKVLQTQLIKVPAGKPPATPGELVVVMSTLNKYGLDPMMRQLYAWRDNRGDLAVMLSLDGWVELARRNPGYVSVSYKYGPDVPKTGKHKACWEWVQATVHTTDRGDVELPPMYLDEWRKDYGQWLEMPRHKMHIISYRMAIREVYGISLDVRDPDDVQAEYHRTEYATQDAAEGMAARLAAMKPGEVVRVESLASMIPLAVDEIEHEPVAVDESEMVPEPKPIIDAPCGVKGCSGMAVARCGECGEWVCAGHLGANGFSCTKHEGAN